MAVSRGLPFRWWYFYTTAVHGKSHRAYIKHGQESDVSEADYVNLSRLRLCRDVPFEMNDLNSL